MAMTKQPTYEFKTTNLTLINYEQTLLPNNRNIFTYSYKIHKVNYKTTANNQKNMDLNTIYFEITFSQI